MENNNKRIKLYNTTIMKKELLNSNVDSNWIQKLELLVNDELFDYNIKNLDEEQNNVNIPNDYIRLLHILLCDRKRLIVENMKIILDKKSLKDCDEISYLYWMTLHKNKLKD
jgi:hypothetical protein